MSCSFLKGDGKDWYKCSFTKKRCGYQRYCSEKNQFITDCEKCPFYKNTQKKESKKNI